MAKWIRFKNFEAALAGRNQRWRMSLAVGLSAVFVAALFPLAGTASAGHGYGRLYTQPGGWNICLDIEGGSTANGARLLQWGCHSGGNQQFRFVREGYDSYVGRYYYSIRAMHSGKCLDVQGEALWAGAKIIQWDCGPWANQHWFVVQHGNGTQEYVARHSHMCLDIPSATTAWGTQMQQYWCNGSWAQRFWYYH